MQDIIEKVAGIIIERGNVVAFSGAGVSKESGIPTFRDPGGLWDRFDPEEYATIYAFRKKHLLYLLFLGIIAFNLLVESMFERQAGVVFYALFNSFLFYYAYSEDKPLINT